LGESVDEDGRAQSAKVKLGFGLILALIAAGCGSSSQLDAKALLERSKTLRSEAAEGALLAEDAVSGKATHIYTHNASRAVAVRPSAPSSNGTDLTA